MSGSIHRAGLTMNELMAPDEFYRAKAQTDAYVQNVALQQQHQERELEGEDYKTIANTAGYLLSLPGEQARADAWSHIYPTLPDHLKARAPETYQGEGWARGAMARAIPALDMWKQQQNIAASQAILGGGGGGGGAPAGGGSAAATPLTPYVGANLPPGVTPDEDQYVRTVFGEARGEPLAGQQAVAYTIKNRSKAGGESTQDVIFRPNAYEPWNNPNTRAQLEQLDPNSPQYQAILNNVVRPVLSGQAQDPTGGATHFYSPSAQKALGRDTPSWATGNQTDIGNHRFFYPGYTAAAPARGVAARTGGTDVAGPGAGPGPAPATSLAMPPDAPTDSAMAPDVRSRVLAAAGGQPNALLGPQPAVAPVESAPAPPAAGSGQAAGTQQAQPAPATPALPRVQAPEEIAAKLGIDSEGLTPLDRRQIAAAVAGGAIQPGQVLQSIEARRQHNQAQVQQVYTQQRQAVADAHQAFEDQRQAQRDRLAQEKADREAVDANRKYQGNSPEAARKNILIAGSQPGGDTSSVEYRDAWADEAYKESQSGGVMIARDMSMFAPPTTKDGKPAIPPAPTVTAGESTIFSRADKLRDEFTARTKTFPDVQIAYENIQKAAEAKDGAGDMSLLYSYVHLLDPGSAVREGEFATAAASGSFGQRVQGAVQRVMSGGRMPDDLRKDFVRESGNIYKNHLRAYEQMADVYTDLANQSKVDPRRVVTRINRPQASDAGASAGPPPPPPGFKVIP